MIKVLFDSSIFLHQKVGGVSKYITQLNENLPKFKVSSKILSPITINDYLNNGLGGSFISEIMGTLIHYLDNSNRWSLGSFTPLCR